jgi:hypothetical protein
VAFSYTLKKPTMPFSTSQFEKRGFRIALIFDGLQPSKMKVALYRARLVEKLGFSTNC